MDDAIWVKLREIVPRHSEKWKEDSSTSNCMSEPCSKKFTFTNRRHHCRICGNIYCNSCLTPITVEADTEFVLTCGKCVKVIVERRKKEAKAKIQKRKEIQEALSARSSGQEKEREVQQAEHVTSFQSHQQFKMRAAMSQRGIKEITKPKEEKKEEKVAEAPEDWKSLNYRLEKMIDRSDPEWVSDDKVVKCGDCGDVFDKENRRHHCRGCGNIFCDDCSPPVAYCPTQVKEDGVRVCKHCAARILHVNAKMTKAHVEKAMLIEKIANEKREQWQKDKEQAEKDKWTNKKSNWTDL